MKPAISSTSPLTNRMIVVIAPTFWSTGAPRSVLRPPSAAERISTVGGQVAGSHSTAWMKRSRMKSVIAAW